ncbi:MULTISPECIES: glutamyl-tRNA reductase [unclassified Campylobacter]|uniref:glutamyl-tRNA reductase n=1 Tax=unclassified Campylobacter TaxID=2593542 RepID=UPI0022E9D095|nr:MULTISPECIES: glutamyl-tRNA reductase [unclassified Campylobacter]MDA3049164.1 glutamyl-tRNA reductase [Campylobacter sp. JMF_15 NE4]MDA3051411.1 glutamyl-tRNA reductase [Campylobacter sp. JMF_02 ED1]MDA3074444.1 glutamyl-tRNA reductase [Campylobacter sp. JMF_05 ED3]
MAYMSVSFTHKNTDITVREKLSFTNDVRKKEILRLLCSNASIKECMVLNTCNRVEIFASVSDYEAASKFTLLALSRVSGVGLDELENRADLYDDDGAIHHLFSVASSLDSLVVGETQIVGQLKDAYKFALENNNTGEDIKSAIDASLKCAASVRTKTEISKNPVSVSSVAVSMAKEKLGSLQGEEAIVCGAGEMSELACKHLLASGAKITILNRNLKNAENLAKSLGEGVKFDSLENLKKYVNINRLFFSATSSATPIITDEIIEAKNFKRYFFDIAVPRDIELSQSEDIVVYSVDDLEEIVKNNLILREEQAHNAYAIIGAQTSEFFDSQNAKAATPLIKALRAKARDIAEIELEKAIKKGYLKNSDKEEARKLIHQVFKSFLHTPTTNLKNLKSKDEIDFATNSLNEIFALKENYEKFLDYENSKTMENKNEI